MSNSPVTTAVFPVAGLGTRFLPVTKTGPKEMLPIVDKPIIQYVVQEAIEAGIKHLVFVTSSEKRSIEDYFDRNLLLEMWLERQGKTEALATIQAILPNDVVISYVRQPEPLGLGHAIKCAQHVVGNQAFAVLLPDDLIDAGSTNCLQEMIKRYQQHQASVVAVEEVALQDVSKYGIIALVKGDPYQRINTMIEKPAPSYAPSRLAVIGRYVLSPTIFQYLASVTCGKGGEIQLTDAIVAMMAQESVYAHPISGCRFDCGDKLGLVKATIRYALRNAHMRESLRSYLKAELEQFEPELV